jgi:hypothetical protein
MLEERHPAFAGLLVVIAEWRKTPGCLREIPLLVVSILRRKRH